MKKTLLVVVFILSSALYSCGGYSTEDIKAESEGTIIESISENYDISPSSIEVTAYTLIQETDNIYTGVMKTEYDGYTQTWDIRVTWDHNTDEYTVEWELLSEN